MGGLTVVAITYILTNIAYFSVLTPEQILESNAVATVNFIFEHSLFFDISLFMQNAASNYR